MLRVHLTFFCIQSSRSLAISRLFFSIITMCHQNCRADFIKQRRTRRLIGLFRLLERDECFYLCGIEGVEHRIALPALAGTFARPLRLLLGLRPVLTSLKERLIKIGAKVVSHGRYIAFQMAEVAIPRQMFQDILRLIAELRPQPPPTPA